MGTLGPLPPSIQGSICSLRPGQAWAIRTLMVSSTAPPHPFLQRLLIWTVLTPHPHSGTSSHPPTQCSALREQKDEQDLALVLQNLHAGKG